MHKFFIDKDGIGKNQITIRNDDVQHIAKVLRLRIGDEIQISDGAGTEYICAIAEVSKKEVVCDIITKSLCMTEAPVSIVLFQGLPKSQKMDLIVQKCVELGVVGIVPVITDRVVVKTDDRDITGKLDRWNRISEEAAKQSNRGIVPCVEAPIAFEEAVRRLADMDLSVIPYELEKGVGLKGILQKHDTVRNAGVFIGPEGGFTEEEVRICLENNIRPVTLGPRILRTETAGFVASSIIQYELGDMGGK